MVFIQIMESKNHHQGRHGGLFLWEAADAQRERAGTTIAGR